MKPPCLERTAVDDFITREQARPQSNKVLHAHPSPMYWTPDDGQARHRWQQRAEVAQLQRMEDSLYLGLPFCIPTDPPHCGFCLFPTADYTGKGQVQKYLARLEQEAGLYGDLLEHDALASIYVGGGTPNLMRDDDYARVLRVATSLYGEVPAAIEKTLEGIPQLFTPDRVSAIREAGFNRVSMGVQQMSDKLIHYSGRTQTHKQVMDALSSFRTNRLACNVDLIFGWPEQTIDDMLCDLAELVAQGVRHITHYQLNIAGRSAFSKTLRPVLPSHEQVIEMYRESVRFLTANGFQQVTVYDWSRAESDVPLWNIPGAGEYQYEALLRDAFSVQAQSVCATRNMVGLGYAAVSFPMTWPAMGGPNWCQMNAKSLERYETALDDGKLPVERQFVHSHVDVRLTWLFQSMQSLRIDTNAYEVIFQADLLSDFAPVWDALAQRGWIEMVAGAICFVNDGAFHVPMLQALLSEARLGELRTSTAQRHWPVNIPIVTA